MSQSTRMNITIQKCGPASGVARQNDSVAKSRRLVIKDDMTARCLITQAQENADNFGSVIKYDLES